MPPIPEPWAQPGSTFSHKVGEKDLFLGNLLWSWNSELAPDSNMWAILYPFPRAEPLTHKHFFQEITTSPAWSHPRPAQG
jgi:hypothetical protein